MAGAELSSAMRTPVFSEARSSAPHRIGNSVLIISIPDAPATGLRSDLGRPWRDQILYLCGRGYDESRRASQPTTRGRSGRTSG